MFRLHLKQQFCTHLLLWHLTEHLDIFNTLQSWQFSPKRYFSATPNPAALSCELSQQMVALPEGYNSSFFLPICFRTRSVTGFSN